jgi:hypothetical protein
MLDDPGKTSREIENICILDDPEKTSREIENLPS